MKISGFTMVKNADKFYFPIVESIKSILPVVDEFVIALGDNEAGDKTEELIRSIDSDKIKIIHRVWDKSAMVDGRIYAEETNFALDQCSGDWCFYLQADECIHEEDHKHIIDYCSKFNDDEEVDALLFNYLHFWGDYEHYLPFRGWYRNEIRLFKNNRAIRSIKDAQSFRKQNDDGSLIKLNVVKSPIRVFHYGWVRPPHVMNSKKDEQDVVHYQTKSQKKEQNYDYGALGNIPVYKGSHPIVMDNRIDQHNWKNELNYTKKSHLNRKKFKHERFKYRLISWIENNVFQKKTIMGYSNWNILKK
jgi:hypothetical protein